MNTETILALAVGAAVTKLVDFAFSLARKGASTTVAVIETQGQLKASDMRLWEKLIMIRKVMESNGMEIPDREWTLPEK